MYLVLEEPYKYAGVSGKFHTILSVTVQKWASRPGSKSNGKIGLGYCPNQKDTDRILTNMITCIR